MAGAAQYAVRAGRSNYAGSAGIVVGVACVYWMRVPHRDVGNMNAVLGIGEEYRIYRYLAGGCGSEHTSPLPDFGTLSGVLQWLSLPG